MIFAVEKEGAIGVVDMPHTWPRVVDGEIRTTDIVPYARPSGQRVNGKDNPQTHFARDDICNAVGWE